MKLLWMWAIGMKKHVFFYWGIWYDGMQDKGKHSSLCSFVFLSWRKKVYSWCVVVYSMYGFQIGFPFLSVIFFQLLKLYILYTTIHQNKLQYLCILKTKKSLVHSSKNCQKTIHQLYTNCSLNISPFVKLNLLWMSADGMRNDLSFFGNMIL